MLNATENYHIIPTDGPCGISYIFGYGNRGARTGRSRVRPLRPSRVSYFRRRTLRTNRAISPLAGTISRLGCIVTFRLTGRIPRVHPPKRSANDRAHEHCRPSRESPMKPTIYTVDGNS